MSLTPAGFKRLELAPAAILGREIIAGHFMGATERTIYRTKDEALEAFKAGWVWWKYADDTKETE